MAKERSEPKTDIVSIERAARILGVAPPQIGMLAGAGKIQMLHGGKRRVSLRSIEMFCEALQNEFDIFRLSSSRNIELTPDPAENFLPFPLADTIGREEALEMLSVSGRLKGGLKVEAYRLTEFSPWRFSRSSVVAFIERSSKRSAFRPDHERGFAEDISKETTNYG